MRFDVLEAKDLSKNTRMMVIMSIMGVMFRSLMTSGSSSLRAYSVAASVSRLLCFCRLAAWSAKKLRGQLIIVSSTRYRS